MEVAQVYRVLPRVGIAGEEGSAGRKRQVDLFVEFAPEEDRKKAVPAAVASAVENFVRQEKGMAALWVVHRLLSVGGEMQEILVVVRVGQ